MGEIYLKLETVSLKEQEGIFAMSMLLPGGRKEQVIMQTEIDPSDSTLDYLGMDRETFEEIMKTHAMSRRMAGDEFLRIAQEVKGKSGKRPLLYVWNDFTSNRLMEYLDSQNLRYYSYFRMTPISVSDLHKFHSRDKNGTVPSRAKDVFESYGLGDEGYLESMRKLVDIFKREM